MAIPSPCIGGGGSGKLRRKATGPIKTILMGYRTVDTMLLHPVSDPDPRKDSLFGGMPLTTPRISTLYRKRKTNPETRKRRMNFFLEIFMAALLNGLFLDQKVLCVTK